MTNDDDDAEDGWEIEDGFGPSLDYGRPRRLPSAATVWRINKCLTHWYISHNTIVMMRRRRVKVVSLWQWQCCCWSIESWGGDGNCVLRNGRLKQYVLCSLVLQEQVGWEAYLTLYDDDDNDDTCGNGVEVVIGMIVSGLHLLFFHRPRPCQCTRQEDYDDDGGDGGDFNSMKTATFTYCSLIF